MDTAAVATSSCAALAREAEEVLEPLLDVAPSCVVATSVGDTVGAVADIALGAMQPTNGKPSCGDSVRAPERFPGAPKAEVERLPRPNVDMEADGTLGLASLDSSLVSPASICPIQRQ